MRIFSATKYLRGLSVPQKFYIIIGLIALILMLELCSFLFVMNTMSAIRAYVNGEGMWSKAQKESVNSLMQYASSFDEADYNSSLSFLSVPLGDKQARLELQKNNPNLAVARQGFLDGGNHPDDVGGLIFLFQKFSSISYMSQAIAIWTEGDTLIEKQAAIGAQMHELIASSNGQPGVIMPAVRPLVRELTSNDVQLTKLENQFSATLGEAFRHIGLLLFDAIILLTLFFGLVGFFVASSISKIVTQVDKAKSEFVALVSHQLRTPLTVIKLSAEVLEKADLSGLVADERKALSNISHEVTEMSSLINTILDVSRIELGTMVVDPRPVDMIAAAKVAVAEARIVAGKKDIQIKELYDPASLVVSMDADMLRVIFQNLLSNAIKYSHPNGSVSFSIVRRSSSILLTVSDTGYGIPKEQQRNIFSKLFRARNVYKVDTGGTGLGLYIVKAIVIEAGGAIWFKSKEGSGTSFYITFPLEGMERKAGNFRI